MQAYVDELKSNLLTTFSDLPWLGRLLNTIVDMLTGPLTGRGTAHYWVNVLGSLFVAVIIYAGYTRARGSWSFSGFRKFCFPREILLHPSTLTDIKVITTNGFVTPFVNVFWRLSGAYFTTAFIGVLTAVLGEQTPLFSWNWATLAVFMLLMMIFDDLGFYLCHLAHHKIPVLWAFHKVHHSAEVMTPLTATRNHPVELILIPPCRAITSSLLIAPALYFTTEQPSIPTLLGMNLLTFAFAMAGEQLHHSHIWVTWPAPLQRIFMCPAQHQIHHSSALRHHDKNMGGPFALWDWLFGTLYIAPREREQFAFGIYGAQKQPHPGLVTAYVVPFIDAGRAALAWLPTSLRNRIEARLRRTSVAAAPGDTPPEPARRAGPA